MQISPWPLEADGLGSTLELIDPLLDNTLPESWQASALHGTPGRENSSGRTDTTDTTGIGPARIVTEFGLFQNYPNPFNANTWIGYMVPSPCHVRIAIYNIHGQCVASIDRMEEPGNHGIVWNGRDRSGRILSTGIYFCRMSTKTYTRTIRMLLTK
jgi:hypothetical protein